GVRPHDRTVLPHNPTVRPHDPTEHLRGLEIQFWLLSVNIMPSHGFLFVVARTPRAIVRLHDLLSGLPLSSACDRTPDLVRPHEAQKLGLMGLCLGHATARWDCVAARARLQL
ncbi:hypothetical protein PIB30_081434, partial [Stylosanthes scabra]|nr:hypothetical protein [Stylosanthes scabra]